MNNNIQKLVVLALLSSGALWAETQWGGTISQNTTWTKAQGPHRIVSDLTIPDGISLTIQAGCQVFFPGKNVVIYGSINASGTAEEPIRFQGTGAQAYAGGITLSSRTTSEFRYTHFNYVASVGVGTTSPQGNHVFERCVFAAFPDKAITLTAAPARILNCVFKGNKGVTWFAYDFDEQSLPFISGCVFNSDGLWIRGGTGGSLMGRSLFAHNRVLSGYGVLCSTSGNANTFNGLTIANCDLGRCSPSLGVSIGYQTYYTAPLTNLVITGCSLGKVDIVFATPLGVITLGNNYWGSTDLAGVLSKITLDNSQPAIDAELLFPIRNTTPFPQADVDNSDGGNATTQVDADLVKKYLVGSAELTPEQLSIADVDGNGTVDVRDALLIESYVNGLIWKLPNK